MRKYSFLFILCILLISACSEGADFGDITFPTTQLTSSQVSRDSIKPLTKELISKRIQEVDALIHDKRVDVFYIDTLWMPCGEGIYDKTIIKGLKAYSFKGELLRLDADVHCKLGNTWEEEYRWIFMNGEVCKSTVSRKKKKMELLEIWHLPGMRFEDPSMSQFIDGKEVFYHGDTWQSKFLWNEACLRKAQEFIESL